MRQSDAAQEGIETHFLWPLIIIIAAEHLGGCGDRT
jgi:hypothetical protein